MLFGSSETIETKRVDGLYVAKNAYRGDYSFFSPSPLFPAEPYHSSSKKVPSTPSASPVAPTKKRS